MTHRAHNPPEYIPWINNSQVTQITYTALYRHLELLCSDSLQLCIYMTSSHILPPKHENAIWTISHPDQFIHILPWAVQCITTPMYYFQITTFRCLLCRHNWECIRQVDINPLPLPVVVTVECCYSSCSSVIVDQQLKLNKNKNNITK